MNLFLRIWNRIRTLGQRRVAKQEIDEELRFHLDQRTAENTSVGMSLDDAAREARRRFGNVQTVREDCRKARGAIFGGGLLRDIDFSLRTLAKSPGFTVVAVLTLAIGIGSATAMFSTIRALVVKPYSSPNGDRLVHLWENGNQPLSTLDYFDIREQATSFAELGIYVPGSINLGGDHPESIHGVSCTPGVLRAFGVAPQLGRWLSPSDEGKGSPPVAVISHRLWQQSLAGDPKAIGRELRLNGASVMVVGVMPASFEFSSPWMQTVNCDIWRPLQLQRDSPGGWWCAIGCLKQGVTRVAADTEVKGIGARLDAAHPAPVPRRPFQVNSLGYEMTHDGISYVWMVSAAMVLLLLVACTNVASLLLARSVRRHGEFGVRIALGATRSQILRLAFCESLLLSLVGTIAGAGMAGATLRYFKFLTDTTDARKAAMVLSGPAFAFAAGLCLLAGLFAGFPPALATLRIAVADLLRTDNRGAAGSGTRHRLLRGLVVTQVAVAFLLANLAVLFSASYAKMLAANASIATDYVLSAELNLLDARYSRSDAQARFCEQLADSAGALPGVAAAGTTTDLPLEWGASSSILANDEVFDPAAQRPSVVFSAITPGYFAAANIAFLKGQTIQTQDVGRYNMGVVVNRAFAEKYWPKQDPLGKIIRPNDANAWFHGHVVGVVENVRQWGVKLEPQPQMFWPSDRAWGKTIFLIVRSPQPAAALTPGLREVVAKLDPDLPLSRIRTFKTIVRDATKGDRGIAGLTNFCMIAAIGLAAIGLYGTLSYHVLRRTREIGVRMAIGADRRDVVSLVFRQGFGWVLTGIIIGIGGVLASAAALRAMLYNINAVSPLALASSASAVVVAAALACWLPAHRASRVEPMEALRCE
jgi:putative ABC transport system permease protein